MLVLPGRQRTSLPDAERKLALENGPCAALDPRDKESRKQIIDLTGGTGVGAGSTSSTPKPPRSSA